MAVLRWLLRIVLAIAAAVALVFLFARFHDGPLGPIPGGPLRGGEEVVEPVLDWSFAKDVAEIDLQLATQSRSRTTWFLTHGSEGYVPCSLGFPPGKTWYREAARDGRATLRIEGRRYPVVLTRLDDDAVAALRPALEEEIRRKYPRTPPSESGVWIFRVESRVAGG